MKEKMNTILKNIGINSERLTLENNLALVLHLLPALIEDAHIMSIGTAGSGKTTAIKKSCDDIIEIDSFSSAELFGHKKNNVVGELKKGAKLAFVEQITAKEGSEANGWGQDLEKLLLAHCNGDNISRLADQPEEKIRTNLVLLGNPPSKESIEFPESSTFLSYVPRGLLSEQWKERLIFLPSFLMEKLTSNTILDISGKDFVCRKRIKWKEFKIRDEDFNIRAFKEVCKIITFLNYFFNDNKALLEEDWKFRGFLSVAKSILALKKGEYKPFYFENKDGRNLAYHFLFNKNEREKIEEIHFLRNRVLIKNKNEDLWKKIAINIYGKEENLKEYEYLKNKEDSRFSKVLNCSTDGMKLEQEYSRLLTDNLKLELYDVDDIKIQKFEQELFKMKNEIKLLKMTLNQVIHSMGTILNKNTSQYISPPTFSIDDSFMLNEKLKRFEIELKQIEELEIPYLNKRDIGIIGDKLLMVNFSDYLK